MTTLADVASAAESLSDSRSRRLLRVLLAVSVAPALVWALVAGPLHAEPAAHAATNILWIAGASHVGMTGWFWFVSEYRNHINKRPYYFYILPLLIAVLCVLFVEATGDIGSTAFMVAYNIWLFYHFGRQNWGLLCLSAAATKSAPPSRAHSWVSWLAITSGISGAIISVYSLSTPEWLWPACFTIAMAATALALWLAGQQVLSGGSRMQAAMLVVVGTFFLPIYLVGPTGILAVAVAHAYQYIVVMGHMAASERDETRSWRWLVPLAVLSVVYLGLFALVRLPEWGAIARPLMVIWYVGIVWHFLSDADLWRLRQPFQRAAVRRRLAFLFR